MADSESGNKMPREEIQPKAYYALNEFPRVTPFSMVTGWRAVSSGRLKSYKVGRRTVVKGQDLINYIEENTRRSSKRKKAA
jgi:hypothetical protein